MAFDLASQAKSVPGVKRHKQPIPAHKKKQALPGPQMQAYTALSG